MLKLCFVFIPLPSSEEKSIIVETEDSGDESEAPDSPTISSDDDRVDRNPPLLRLELNESDVEGDLNSIRFSNSDDNGNVDLDLEICSSDSEVENISSSSEIIVISSSESSGCESPVYAISVSSDDYSEISDTPSYWGTDEELDIGNEEYPILV